jgi:hypothetical protein
VAGVGVAAGADPHAASAIEMTTRTTTKFRCFMIYLAVECAMSMIAFDWFEKFDSFSDVSQPCQTLGTS